jgi:hypothetical protein
MCMEYTDYSHDGGYSGGHRLKDKGVSSKSGLDHLFKVAYRSRVAGAGEICS